MKTTYLINQVQPNGDIRLAVATAEEWHAITKANKSLPAKQRRYFITDYIAENGGLDCMVIEVTADYYREWNRERTAEERNRVLGKKFQRLSADAPLFSVDGSEYFWDVIPDETLVEELVCDKIFLQELKKVLAEWKPWANDLLELYLHGKKRACTKIMAKKYKVSPQVIRKYKRQFEEFLKNFF